jgi:hypothetical protein
MTHRNVDLHGRIYDAFNARDVDALLALCDPGISTYSRSTCCTDVDATAAPASPCRAPR